MKNFPLRLKDNTLFDDVKRLSEEEERSINNLINVLLKEALEARKNKN